MVGRREEGDAAESDATAWEEPEQLKEYLKNRRAQASGSSRGICILCRRMLVGVGALTSQGERGGKSVVGMVWWEELDNNQLVNEN